MLLPEGKIYGKMKAPPDAFTFDISIRGAK